MPPRLRGACSVFWMVWVTSISYWVGVWTFDEKYSVQTEKIGDVEIIMFAICIASACLANIGCCLIFFDITHLCCVLLYSVPLALTVPTLATVAFIHLDKVHTLTPIPIQKEIVNYWDKHGQPPSYLTQVEKDLECCGIYGPTDYRSFIYGRHCESQKIDVPYSCCNLTNLFSQGGNTKHKMCSVLASQNIFGLGNSDCLANFTGNENEVKKKCRCINNLTNIMAGFENEIYKTGCVYHLSDNTQHVMDIHLVFIGIFPILSVIMLVTFLKAWCKAPEVVEMYPYYAKSQSSMVTYVANEKARSVRNEVSKPGTRKFGGK